MNEKQQPDVASLSQAHLYLQRGDYAAARAQLKQVLAADPTRQDAIDLLLQVERQRQKVELGLQPKVGPSVQTDIKEKRWTWRQRFILFTIYFTLLFKLIPGVVFLIIGFLWGVSFYRRVPLHPLLEIALALSLAAVWLTEAYGPRLLHYAVSRL